MRKALTTKPTKGKKLGSNTPTSDHLGNDYDSFSAMCKAYDKLPVTVRHRLHIGLSLKDALTLSEVKKAKNGGVKDHLGNWFASKEEMCSKYGISVACYNNRLKYGWEQGKALTTEVRKLVRIGKCK